MPWILLESLGKPPKFTNHLSSMYPDGNTQLQIRKWWVPIRSALYLFYSRSDLCQYLSIISTMCPPEKTLKETVHFFKTMMLYPSKAPLSNYVKLKSISKVYHMLYNDRAGKNTIYKCQHTDIFTIKLCALLYYVHKTTYYRINCNRPCVLVRFHTQRRFCAILSVRTPDSHHPVTYVRIFKRSSPVT